AETFLPVATEPVNEILAMPGCSQIHWPRSLPPARMLSTPGGKIARLMRPISKVVKGVYGDGFKTTVLPVYSACVIFGAASTMGTFHGVMAPITPSGR